MQKACEAWEQIKPLTMRNCWLHVGLVDPKGLEYGPERFMTFIEEDLEEEREWRESYPGEPEAYDAF